MPRENLRKTGSQMEEAAAAYLTERGVTILERNFRSRTAEIDIVGKQDGTLLFIEVKARAENQKSGTAPEAVAWAVGLVEPARIDEINILQATYEAMRLAIAQLKVRPSVLVNDAVTIPGVQIPQVPVVKGDAKCISIAAASILAKVTRDRILEEMDALYPEYGFAKHKGYGTKEHMDAIREYGPCPIHRRSFITKIVS